MAEGLWLNGTRINGWRIPGAGADTTPLLKMVETASADLDATSRKIIDIAIQAATTRQHGRRESLMGSKLPGERLAERMVKAQAVDIQAINTAREALSNMTSVIRENRMGMADATISRSLSDLAEAVERSGTVLDEAMATLADALGQEQEQGQRSRSNPQPRPEG